MQQPHGNIPFQATTTMQPNASKTHSRHKSHLLPEVLSPRSNIQETFSPLARPLPPGNTNQPLPHYNWSR
ncbi:hypothetical protein BDV19DRAFT_361357 [Aspergillus venezuelensis]